MRASEYGRCVDARIGRVELVAVTLVLIALASLGNIAYGAPSGEANATNSAEDEGACGPEDVTLRPAKVERTAHGATVYTYQAPNGRSFVQVAPPPGFAPLTASDAVLAEAGFPRRPQNSASLCIVEYGDGRVQG